MTKTQLRLRLLKLRIHNAYLRFRNAWLRRALNIKRRTS